MALVELQAKYRDQNFLIVNKALFLFINLKLLKAGTYIYIPGTSLVKIIFKSYVSVLSYFLKTTKLVCLSRVIFCKEVIYFIICEQNMTIFLHNKAFYSRLFLNFFFLNVGQTLQILKLTFKTL